MTIENQSYSCPNPSCGKAFPNPIKAKNLSSKDSEPYDACPYCLTEIVPVEVSADLEEESQPEVDKMEPKVEALSPTEDVRAKASPKKVQGCSLHFGYLSQRSPKEKIPEDCITCESIVQCMLKAVTG